MKKLMLQSMFCDPSLSPPVYLVPSPLQTISSLDTMNCMRNATKQIAQHMHM